MKHSTFGNPMVEMVFDNKTTDVDKMTVAGTAAKTMLLVGITVASAAMAWVSVGTADNVPIGMMWVALFGALGLAILAGFKPHTAIVVGPAYAVVKGTALGWLSLLYNDAYDGIPMQAAMVTLVITLAVTAVYSTGKIRPSQKFRSVIGSLTLGVLLLYLATIGLSFFGVDVALVTGNSNGAILLNVVILGIAIANLVVDYSYIEDNVGRAGKQTEWFGAFAVLTTVVWIYIEVLRLLAKSQSRR